MKKSLPLKLLKRINVLIIFASMVTSCIQISNRLVQSACILLCESRETTALQELSRLLYSIQLDGNPTPLENLQDAERKKCLVNHARFHPQPITSLPMTGMVYPTEKHL